MMAIKRRKILLIHHPKPYPPHTKMAVTFCISLVGDSIVNTCYHNTNSLLPFK